MDKNNNLKIHGGKMFIVRNGYLLCNSRINTVYCAKPQLSDLSCPCYEESDSPGHQMICAFLFLLMFSGVFVPGLALIIMMIVAYIGKLFLCPWAYIHEP
jgi:hypothetical protein